MLELASFIAKLAEIGAFLQQNFFCGIRTCVKKIDKYHVWDL